ncbi:hypothetical protein J132_09613 [Termitomyces sp. J132]|nr:hypothetical protein J132_09613 [Termitomyces sp. J132]
MNTPASALPPPKEELADCTFATPPLLSLIFVINILFLLTARRVIDLLRDKLHHLSSTLAETQNYVRELEDTRRESREQVKSFLEKVEKEADERVEVAKKRMEEMEGEFKTLREYLRLEHLTKKLHELEEAHNTTIVALGAARSERTELGRADGGMLRVACFPFISHTVVSHSRSFSFTEAEEKQRSEAAAHAKRSDAAKKATEEVQDSRRQTEAQIAAGPDDVSLIRDADDILLKLLQGRFYPQAMMLRLTKEQYEDTQKRFTVSEAAPH